jgi:hypothetical protein
MKALNKPLEGSIFLAQDRRFVRAAIRRERLFLALSLVGVAVAVGLALFCGYRRWADSDFALGLRGVVVLLILLNARQNLRQYRYARILGALLQSPVSHGQDELPEPASRERADRSR